MPALPLFSPHSGSPSSVYLSSGYAASSASSCAFASSASAAALAFACSLTCDTRAASPLAWRSLEGAVDGPRALHGHDTLARSSPRPRADALARCLEHYVAARILRFGCSGGSHCAALRLLGVFDADCRNVLQQPRVRTIRRLQPTGGHRVEHFLIGCACATLQTSR